VLDVITWLLVVELLGLLAFPLVYLLLRWLPDRGWTVAKPLSLLLVSYPLWLLASTSLVPNATLVLWLLVLALAAASGAVAWYARKGLREFLGLEWPVLVVSEMVFLAIFTVWAVIKAQDPAISHTEQPMDFAFLNATMVSRHFPPQDPWLAGQPVSYYYFGYLIFGGLVRLTGVVNSVGYNLALVSVAALAAAAIFGLGMNLVRLAGGSVRSAALCGLAAAFLLLGIANLESGLELLRAGGKSSPDFWQWVGIKGLDGPMASTTWYPTEPGWWWWRATRVIDTLKNGNSLDYTITEFPFFSFLLGDLHPHVMSLPFVLAFAGLVLNLFVAPVRLGLRWLASRGGVLMLLAIALSLGALGFINLWDLPVFGALFAGAVLVKLYGQERSLRRMALNTLAVVISVVALALLLYLPFYFSFHSQAKGVLPVGAYVTRNFHFFVVWGLFALIVVPFLVWELAASLRRASRSWRVLAVALVFSMLPWLAWTVVQLILNADVSLWQRLLHILPLALAMAVALYAALRRVVSPLPVGGALPQESGGGSSDIVETDSIPPLSVSEKGIQGVRSKPSAGEPSERKAAPSDVHVTAFPLLLMALAALLLVGTELFYLVDVFNSRMNTIFKLYYQAWMLLALVSAWALYYLGFRFGRAWPWAKLAGYVWVGLLAVGLVASVYYPAAIAYTKTSGPSGSGTLDGLAYVGSANSGELRAIRWLQASYQMGDVIIEAVGDDYSDFGRVSASTGVPTVLGWMGHEEQWRGSRKPFDGRVEEVEKFYRTSDVQEAKAILKKYGVTYVIVGAREQAKYGVQPQEKLVALGDLAYPSEGGMAIYRVRQ